MNMSLKIKKQSLWYYLPAIVLIVFGGLSVFLDSTAFYFDFFNFLCAVAVGISFYLSFSHKSKRYTKRDGWILLLAVLMIIESNIRSSWNFSHRCVFAISILICIAALKETNINKPIEYILRVLFILYLIYALVTILCALVPGLYEGSIINLFPENRFILLRQWHHGGNPGLTNHYSTNGMLLAAGFCIAFSGYISNRKKRWLILSLVLFLAVILSGKRAHFLFCGFAAILLLYLSYKEKSIINKWLRLLLVIGFVLIVGYVVVNLRGQDIGIVSRFADISEADDVSRGRFALWLGGLYSFLHHPIIGIGWKQFCRQIGPHIQYGSLLYDTHNVYIQLLCETGIIGALVFFMWFVRIFATTMRQFKQYRGKKDNQFFLLAFSLMYQCFFFMYCITGNPLYDYMTFVPYFLACTITIWFTRRQEAQLQLELDNS